MSDLKYAFLRMIVSFLFLAGVIGQFLWSYTPWSYETACILWVLLLMTG